ncbi:MAG: sigma-54-dependent Fis family transcriptional regulator [Bdellovibrionaceae bacterium]|nr:sigma-54-dependent Fis family transcriptional regulator [Pseudobdellovibrionaceae bacterium]
MKKRKILVVDDESSIRDFLNIMLTKEGYDVVCAEDGAQALSVYRKQSFDMVISDLQMPNMTGLELLKQLVKENSSVLFMVITAFGSMETAIEAMKLGAYDYLTKPFNIEEVQINLKKAFSAKDLEVENRFLRREVQQEYSFDNCIGDSEPMHQVFDLIKKVSPSQSNILIIGESGTGKEVVARAIHNNSLVSRAAFVPVNCGAIPSELIESEFFGHRKGAFTGAVSDKEGLFEAASGGTLFLDEVGELPLEMQAKLLRVLQEKEIRKVGSTENIKVDVRILSATNRDLLEMVKTGAFREDLFYRINVIEVSLPPLRSRGDDVILLANYALKKFAKKFDKSVSQLSAEAAEKLKKYRYPGNVRELENIIERIIAIESEPIILPEHLPPLLLELSQPEQLNVLKNFQFTSKGIFLDKVLDELEKELLVKALHLSNGVKKVAAKLLNITFRSMRYRLEKHLLEKDEKDEKELGTAS